MEDRLMYACKALFCQLPLCTPSLSVKSNICNNEKILLQFFQNTWYFRKCYICLVYVLLLLCLAPRSVQRQIHCCPCKESAESRCSSLTRPGSSLTLLQWSPRDLYHHVNPGVTNKAHAQELSGPMSFLILSCAVRSYHTESVWRDVSQSSRTLQVTMKIRFIHGNRRSVQSVLETCLHAQSLQISAFLCGRLYSVPIFPGKTKQKRLCIRLALCVVG